MYVYLYLIYIDIFKANIVFFLWPVLNGIHIIVNSSLRLCFKRGWDFSPFDYI